MTPPIAILRDASSKSDGATNTLIAAGLLREFAGLERLVRRDWM